jgi:hypothetical protein
VRLSRVLAVSAAALLWAVPAAAQEGGVHVEDGVHVDPDSPTGKEYAFPLAQAREDNSGSRSERAPTTPEQPPLFGEGVTPSRGGSGSPGRARPSRGARPSRSGARRTAPVGAEPASARLAEVSSGGVGWSLALAAGVILAGGLIGVAARRIARRRT